jgi:hypothetical protein
LLIGFLCTVSAVLLVHKRPIAYQSCGDVMVAEPITPTSPNIYDDPDNPPIATTSVITQELMSDQTQRMLAAEGLTASYNAEPVNLGTGQAPVYSEPLATVCASSYNSQLSLRTADAVVTQFGVLLRARQAAAHVAPQSLLTDAVIVMPATLPVLGRPSQAYLGVAAIGFTCTAVGALWADERLMRRKRAKGST